MSKQLLRSETSVGALVREAQNAENKADFIHKLAIAQKECDESYIDLSFWFKRNIYHLQNLKILILTHQKD